MENGWIAGLLIIVDNQLLMSGILSIFVQQALEVSNFHQEARDIGSQGVTFTYGVCVCVCYRWITVT